jgi:hypothetical protein
VSTPVQEDLERFTRDMLYLDAHRDELLRQFPEHWVAIYREEVVGAAKDAEELVRQLEQKHLPPGRVFRQLLTERDDLLIL